jgi:hypothetical protein
MLYFLNLVTSDKSDISLFLSFFCLGFKKDDWEKLFDETISEFDTSFNYL